MPAPLDELCSFAQSLRFHRDLLLHRFCIHEHSGSRTRLELYLPCPGPGLFACGPPFRPGSVL